MFPQIGSRDAEGLLCQGAHTLQRSGPPIPCHIVWAPNSCAYEHVEALGTITWGQTSYLANCPPVQCHSGPVHHWAS